MTVLILAAGEQTRWLEGNDNAGLKQLVDIAGQPLLERTVNQVQAEWEYEPIVVTHRKELEAFGPSFDPPERYSVLHTLRSTSLYWTGDRTVVLLGDVVYSPEALAKISLCTEPVIFYGRRELRWRLVGQYYEFFAISFSRGGGQVLGAMIDGTLARASRKKGQKFTSDDKIRGLYEFWAGLKNGRFLHEDQLFYPIEDWTEDIDAIEDYEAFVDIAVGRGWCNACYNGS